jgi:tetratricopeptide (TPR) repeat protein
LIEASNQAVRIARATWNLDAEYACLLALWQLYAAGGHPDVQAHVTTLSRLGLAAARLRRHAEAAGSFSKAIELGGAERVVGEVDHLLGYLADAYGASGRHVEKRKLLTRVLESQVQRCGKDHPEVGRTLTRLGVVVGDLGDASQRIKLLERGLQLQRKHLGDEHADVAVTLTNLASTYNSVHRIDDARQALVQALTIKVAVFGATSLDAATTMANLGRLYLQCGEPALALDVLLQAYATRHRQLPPQQPRLSPGHGMQSNLVTTHLAELVLSASLQLARVRWGEGKLSEALEHTRRAAALAAERDDGGKEVKIALDALESQLLIQLNA